MKIDISDIIKTEGAFLQLDCSEKVDGIDQFEDISFDAPVTLKATLTNTGGLLKLDGILETHYKGKCSKCLKEVEADLKLKIRETIVNGEKFHEDIEAYTYEGKFVDLDRVIKDNIILSLPMRLLCRENCKGVCPVCGRDRNIEDCGCSQDDLNPKMEVLKKLLDN